MTSNVSDRPLDHVTARIVAELAAALLPSLEAAVAAEVTKAVEALPKRTNQAFEENLIALNRLRESSEAIVATLEAAKDSIRETSVDVLPSLSEICERLDAAAAAISRFVEQSIEQSIVENGVKATDLNDAAKVLHAVEVGISNWEGILKAEGRVQTRELSEFSSEILELTKDMKSSLPQALEEIVKKVIASRGGEWARVMKENLQAIDTRLTKLEKLFTLGGVVAVICLAAIAAAVFR